MDLALGKSSGGAMRPCGDKLIASKLAEDSLLAMDRAHALFTIVTAVSVQLYSLLDSSGRLQESSRKYALLQATYLPKRKTVMTHHFNPFCFGHCTSAGAEMQGVFQVRRIIFYHAINKEYTRGQVRLAAGLARWIKIQIRDSAARRRCGPSCRKRQSHISQWSEPPLPAIRRSRSGH